MELLRFLAAGRHQIVGVLASPDDETQTGATVWQMAGRLGLRRFPATAALTSSFWDTARHLRPDLLLSMRSLLLVPEAGCNIATIGAFNLHTGPLPRYAGKNALNWAIYRDEREYGVTVHRMTATLDGGDIAYQQRFAMDAGETGLSLTRKCTRVGLELMKRLISDAEADPGSIPRVPQNRSERVHVKGCPVPGGRLDFREPAAVLERYVRACHYFPFPSPWPMPRVTFAGREFFLISARTTGKAASAPPGTISDAHEGEWLVACGDEWLALSRVEPVDDVADRHIGASQR